MHKKLFAEALGTFTLVLAVLASLHAGNPVVVTPIAAAIVLGLFVYTIGNRSGCHINPAVTIGLWSIGKMNLNDSISYIIAQLLGALIALGVSSTLLGTLTAVADVGSTSTFLAEFIGSVLFGFGIAAVVFNKVPDAVNGVVIGGSLLLGIILAVAFGAAGVLNPAVAVALGAFNLTYLIGSIVGVTVGMHLYKQLIA
jgi:aquaporin Z